MKLCSNCEIELIQGCPHYYETWYDGPLYACPSCDYAWHQYKIAEGEKNAGFIEGGEYVLNHEEFMKAYPLLTVPACNYCPNKVKCIAISLASRI